MVQAQGTSWAITATLVICLCLSTEAARKLLGHSQQVKSNNALLRRLSEATFMNAGLLRAGEALPGATDAWARAHGTHHRRAMMEMASAPKPGVNITTFPCEWEESDESSFGGNCFINTTWIAAVSTEVAPIERARMSWEARAAACSNHLISYEVRATGSGSGDPLAGFDPSSLVASELEACYSDTDNLCYVDLYTDGQPKCFTASDSYEFSELLCPLSPLHIVHTCLSLNDEDCRLTEECVDLLDDMLSDPNWAPKDVLDYWNATGSNGTGWFSYGYCWPVIMSEDIFNEDGSHKPFGEYMGALGDKVNALISRQDYLPPNYTLDEFYGNCTYGRNLAFAIRARDSCSAISNGPTLGLLTQANTSTGSTGSSSFTLELDEALAAKCASQAAPEPLGELCNVALRTGEGGDLTAFCTSSPVVANFANFAQDPLVLEGFRVCYTEDTKFSSRNCTSASITYELVETGSGSGSGSGSGDGM